MNKLFRIRAIQLSMVLVVSCLCISCSHLNVDFDSSWSARDITVVVVEHEQAPNEVTTADIVNILTRSGWHVVADGQQAQARVVCRWARQADLTAESEAVEVVKSFHVQVISVEQPKVLAVADYFYSNNSEELLDGVNAALMAMTDNTVATAAHPDVAEVQAVVVPNAVVAATLSSAVKISPVKQVTSQPAVTEQVVSASQPVVQSQLDEQTVIVEDVSSIATELPLAAPAPQVLALESAEPVSMEKSPWVPRFQGLGLDEWGKE